MRKLFFQILISIFGLFLATKLVSGIEIKLIPEKSEYLKIKFSEDWQIIFFIGTIMGLINFFIKPILNLLTLPLKILTFGISSLILNMAILWIIDQIFPELKFESLSSLFFTTIILLVLNVFFK